MPKRNLSLAKVEELARRALEGSGTRLESAASLARAVAAAERDGIASHGLVYVPVYCEHVQCGKVIGTAIPKVEQPSSSAVVEERVQLGKSS